MNEEPTSHRGPPIETQAAASVGVGSPGRRRLIKLGAGALPASLTLVSRPVHAFACNSTSAWGSTQINPAASVRATAAGKATYIERWSLTEWINNTTHSPLAVPWNTLGSTTSGVVTGLSKNMTLSGIFGAVQYPVGLAGTDKVWDRLSNTVATTLFQRYMLVAMLNSKLIGTNLTFGPDRCLPTAALTDMLDGSYTVPSTAVVWGQAEIIAYLLANNLVAP